MVHGNNTASVEQGAAIPMPCIVQNCLTFFQVLLRLDRVF